MSRPTKGGFTPSGFTLIEAMIVVVVLAILAAIAVPSYRSYLLRAQRTEATAALLRAAAAQEKFFLQQNRYASDLAAAPPAGLGQSAVTERGYYTITNTVTEPSGDGFRVTATPRNGGGQQQDSLCAQFQLDHNGVRGARNAADEDATANCWR
jgi:type IV pilus assembly protein PilE